MTQHDILTTRELKPGDFEAWFPLWGQYLALNQTRMRWTDRTALFRKLAHREGNAGAMVVECNGEMVGIAHFERHESPYAFENAYVVQDLYITPEAQAQKAGSTLIRAIYQQGMQEGAPLIYWMAAEASIRGQDAQAAVAVTSPFLQFRKAA
ncbi:GNAT family N-acetyltransferase [Pseudorhodobacter sp. E13]|nr:GNAT family N-acetyltransferase [Pseudorhodobacter sp. E13]